MKKSFVFGTALLTAAVVLCGCSLERAEDASVQDCGGICVIDAEIARDDCPDPMTWVQGRCVNRSTGEVTGDSKERCMSRGHQWVEGYCIVPQELCDDRGGTWIELTVLDLNARGRYIRQLPDGRYICGSYNEIISGIVPDKNSCSNAESALLKKYISQKRCSESAPHCYGMASSDSASSRLLMCSECMPGSARCIDKSGHYVCIDLDGNDDHCGRCGNSCPDGSRCTDGVCRMESLVCPANTLNCGKKEDGSPLCIDPNDNHSCGAKCENGAYLKDDKGKELKGKSCGKNAVCNAGECECISSTLACLIDGDVHCIDPMIDSAYCGAYNDTNKTVTADGAGCPFDHAGKVCKNEKYASGDCGLGKCLCADNYVRCGDQCIDPKSDPEFCGVDRNCEGGEKCMAPSTCNDGKCGCKDGLFYCDGKCIDPASDESCGITEKCDDGVKCGDYQTCDPKSLKCVCDETKGYLQCGNDCIDPKSDPKHCGAASCTAEDKDGKICSGQNAVCVNGVCTNKCPDGQELCNGVCMVLNTRDHCGKCGNKCLGETVCTEFGSSYACKCPAGKEECAWNKEKLCLSEAELKERNLRNNGTICGCAADYGDCDGKPFNGCEISLKTDSNHCGQCGKTCGSGAECKNGNCSTVCPSNTTLCGNECVDLKSNTNHCGQCGKPCASGAECKDGKCLCPNNMKLCGNECVDTKTDKNNCGGCGNENKKYKCGIEEACNHGKCEYKDVKECKKDEIRCIVNGSQKEICVNIKNERDHCGGCNFRCDGECKDGKCDGKKLNEDRYNCGGTGNFCHYYSDKTCKAGKCICYTKGGDQVNVPIDLNTDHDNCGRCARKCGGDAVCNHGKCYWREGESECRAIGEDSDGKQNNCCTRNHYQDWDWGYYCTE